MYVVKSAEGAEPQKAPRVCPKCGERFFDDALFCPNDGSPLASPQRASSSDQSDPYIGSEISGHIRIQSLAGVGAMGRVYRAFQMGVERDVAVKILHRELSANQQLVQRFHREAKVASRLSHPNVVHVHLAGQLQDGALYIVMEYLDGLSLQSALAAGGGAMDLPRALHLSVQMCDAVGEAHAQGVVHRDLKPENVMLVKRGGDPDFVKVLDFGIARLNWGEQSMATAAGLIFGTARYISPEGAQGEIVGPQGDVYSIATLLYQMLAGRTPFEGDQAVALLVQQIHDPPPPLRSIPRAGYVPEPIAQMVMRNLGKDPATREPDARAFGRALLDAAKASGLATDDLAHRPLLSSRPSGAVQLAPMARTKQLQLDAGMQEKLAQASRSAQTPSPVPPEPSNVARPVSSPPSQPSQPGGVDVTLDDVEAPPIPPTPAPPNFNKTEMSAPLPIVIPPNVPSRQSLPREPSMPDDDVPSVSPRRRMGARAAAIFILCFLVGVGGATLVAYKLGFVGPNAESLDREVEHAHTAFVQRHYDSPPGDNVADITDEALKKWPNDPKLLEIRRETSDEITKQAASEWAVGSKPEALRLMQLALRLDPNDDSVKKLVASYTADLADAGIAVNAGKDAGIPGLHPAPTPTVFAPNVAHVIVDFTPAAPRMGSPVSFSTKLGVGNGKPKAVPAEPIYEIAGPGLTGIIRLPPTCDVTACNAQFTFLEAGRYTVTFSAKIDGQAVKAARLVPISNGQGVPPTGSENIPPLPSATGKWM
jgi:serine/threonine-protein kinase